MEDNQQEEATGMLDFCLKKKESLLSEGEIVPYVKGIVFASKKSKKPFEQLLDENLNGLFFYNNSNFKNRMMKSPDWATISQIISDIKVTVINRAKQLYPYLRRQQ